MTVRERIEVQERSLLQERAAFADSSLGRARPVEPCPLRTCFMRDRDRVIHSKAFRRLKHKTQCFLAPEGDHYRTRLTHTLEVSQLSRTVARALCLNEDLTEAISLAHDLGHTPFGHMGERTLARLTGHFEHNEQSLRVVTVLEDLNLTAEVLDGIVNHTSAGVPATLEGRIVQNCDQIAYINHDIDDALRAGVLHVGEIPQELTRLLGASHGQRIDTMVGELVYNFQKTGQMCMGEEIHAATQALRAFMFDHVYTRAAARDEERRTGMVLEKLYEHYMAHLDDLPPEFHPVWEKEGASRAVCDHLASMTDRYALSTFSHLFMPLG